MKIITASLSGAALDWAVAQCDTRPRVLIGKHVFYYDSNGDMQRYRPSVEWRNGGPIIERERINIEPYGLGWKARMPAFDMMGDTPLAAAMRCYVASKLGDEVEVPEELL